MSNKINYLCMVQWSGLASPVTGFASMAAGPAKSAD